MPPSKTSQDVKIEVGGAVKMTLRVDVVAVDVDDDREGDDLSVRLEAAEVRDELEHKEALEAALEVEHAAVQDRGALVLDLEPRGGAAAAVAAAAVVTELLSGGCGGLAGGGRGGRGGGAVGGLGGAVFSGGGGLGGGR
jgi:hypothetical protein